MLVFIYITVISDRQQQNGLGKYYSLCLTN
jgi:hypothetical protein